MQSPLYNSCPAFVKDMSPKLFLNASIGDRRSPTASAGGSGPRSSRLAAVASARGGDGRGGLRGA
jgi:hypothetical protein